MIDKLLPFLMFGIFLAAILAKPLARQKLVSLPAALVILGFVSSEIWVAMGQDTGLRWQILSDLVFYLLLPILIFEAAININIRSLRREGLIIGALSVPLLLIAATIAGGVLDFFIGVSLGNSFALALLIGAMVCATDPTALPVIGSHGKGNRLAQILEGESLINDATSITLFVMLSAMLIDPQSEISAISVIGRFLTTMLGAALVGIFLGWLFDRIIRPLNDMVLTSSATLVLAFLSFWVGEHLLGLSGVVATLCSGLTFVLFQKQHRSEEDVTFARHSWSLLGFCADAMLFFLVGMSITVDMFRDHWLAMLVGILAALISRAVIVFLGAGPLSRLPGQAMLLLKDQNVIMWGGIRGAVAIALALSLSVDIPFWYTIQSAVYGVALFSLLLQTPLLAILVPSGGGQSNTGASNSQTLSSTLD
jgi:CPA1 family monovalent cation:H+ antiporter